MFIPGSELLREINIEKDKFLEDRYVVKYKGKVMGYIIDRNKYKVYLTRRRFDEHYFRIYDGYGISTSILAILRRNGVDKVVIIEETDIGEKLLISNLEDWFEKGFDYTFEFTDGTKDHQKVLSVANMVVKV